MLTCAVLLCTKDRIEEPVNFLSSLGRQTRLPDEVVVVDGAANADLRGRVESLPFFPDLRYATTSGDLTTGRNAAVALSSSDIVFFLDDDLVLDRRFIEEVMKVFESDAENRIGGVCGTIVGYRSQSGLRRLLNAVFFLPGDGDGRFRLSGAPTWLYGRTDPADVEFLPGGLTAYRRPVFELGGFDERLPLFGFTDDVDFSFRISRRFMNRYCPTARAEHLRPPSDRAMRVALLRTWIWAYWRTYHRNRGFNLVGYPALVLLSVGFLLRFVESHFRARFVRRKGVGAKDAAVAL